MSSKSVIPTRRAWLHLNEGATYLFEPSQRYGELVHETPSGVIYALFSDHQFGKAFWIGRLHESTYGRSPRDRRKFWVSSELELQALSIEFENGGKYIFPL